MKSKIMFYLKIAKIFCQLKYQEIAYFVTKELFRTILFSLVAIVVIAPVTCIIVGIPYGLAALIANHYSLSTTAKENYYVGFFMIEFLLCFIIPWLWGNLKKATKMAKSELATTN